MNNGEPDEMSENPDKMEQYLKKKKEEYKYKNIKEYMALASVNNAIERSREMGEAAEANKKKEKELQEADAANGVTEANVTVEADTEDEKVEQRLAALRKS